MRRYLWLLVLLVFIPSFGVLGPGHPTGAAEEEPASKPDPQTQQAKEYFRQGLAAAKAGAYEEAIQWFEASVRLRPEVVPIQFSLGSTYEKVGRLADAERVYREVLRLQPDLPKAHLNLGNTLESAGKLSEAEQAYREALRLEPKFARAHNNLAWLLVSAPDTAARRPEEALVHAQEAVRLTERMEDNPLDTLAEVHYALGQCLKAIWTEEEAVNLEPNNAAYRTSLRRFQLCRDATWAARDGDVAKARKHWQAILALAPNDGRAKEALARLP